MKYMWFLVLYEYEEKVQEVGICWNKKKKKHCTVMLYIAVDKKITWLLTFYLILSSDNNWSDERWALIVCWVEIWLLQVTQFIEA